MAKSGKPTSGADADAADYAVGYAKPPAHSRFAKGRSGNPGGGSAKARARRSAHADSAFDQIILDEVSRPVAFTEHGQRKHISTYQAIHRSLMIDAVKGNRSAQKLALTAVEAAHERHRAAATERFGLLVQYHTSQIAIGNGLPSPGHGQNWPSPVDVILDYRRCEGQVMGPINADQAEPLFAIVAEHRLWRARQEHLQAARSPASGEIAGLYTLATNAIAGMLDKISDALPPSFLACLDGAEGAAPPHALVMDDGKGGTINLAVLSPEGADTADALYFVHAAAKQAMRDLPRRARLDIAANTTSLIHRLQVERRHGEAGLGPALSVPDFADFYGTMASGDSGSDDEAMP